MCIELLTGRSLCSFRVKASNSVRCDLCRGCFFVRCERSVLSCDRHAPVWRERYASTVFLGRLTTWRHHIGFSGGNMGLCAGRKRGSSQNNGKPLHDAPYARARAQSRAYANCFDVNVRSSGTATGKHIVPPPTESDTQGSQSNRGGTKSGERYCGIIHAISCQCCH